VKVTVFVIAVCVLVLAVLKGMFVCSVTEELWPPTEAAAASALITNEHVERYKIRQVYSLLLQVQI